MIVNVIDYLLFLLFCIPTIYLTIFAISSVVNKREPKPTKENPFNFLIIIPAFKEDRVILDSVNSCLSQDYPKEKFKVVVVSDSMSDEVNSELSKLPIFVKRIALDHSTKSKAINEGLKDYSGYDSVLILDADNLMERQFLQKINAAFNEGAVIVQGHRTAKNQNNNIAVLDAMSEEINNSIFRKGHYNLGFSSALIGSAMAFKFDQFKSIMQHVNVVGGFDKELEHIYLLNKVKIHYLNNAIVLDEKIQKSEHFAQQRRRWMAAQVEHLTRFFPLFLMGVQQRNRDFCDKVFQMLLLPRILILGGIVFSFLLFSVVDFERAEKWLILMMIFLFSLIISIPRRIVTVKLFKALFTLPKIFGIVLLNMFKLKNANKQFIHTPHGRV